MIALLCLLLVQDTAEATFKKIEETLQKAETIKVVVSATAERTSGGETSKAAVEGTLLIKGSDKVRATMKMTVEGEGTQSADARATGGKIQGIKKEGVDMPAKFREQVVSTFARLGGGFAIQAVIQAGAGRPMPKAPETSNLVLKGVENGVGTLTLDAVYDGTTWNVSLEFEDKTYKLRKATARKVVEDPSSPGKSGVGRTIVDTLTVELGAKIDDKEFE